MPATVSWCIIAWNTIFFQIPFELLQNTYWHEVAQLRMAVSWNGREKKNAHTHGQVKESRLICIEYSDQK